LGFFVLVGFGSRGLVLVGFFLSFFGLFFFISSFACSLVYCRCTKGRLTLLIKSNYYLSKKIFSIYLGVPYAFNKTFFYLSKKHIFKVYYSTHDFFNINSLNNSLLLNLSFCYNRVLHKHPQQ